jgi:hypothetical protein
VDSLSVAILVPVLARPHRVAPLLESIAAATPEPYRVLFICDRHDREEHQAIDAVGGDRVTFEGGWARKINRGCALTDEPLVVLAADDLSFRPRWLERATAAMTDGVQVVGLNDLIPRPRRPEHATHFLLTREAAEMPCLDGSRGPVCEAYGHWRTDDELIATASKRGMYRYAPDAILEHIGHPMLGGPDDETYAKGRASARRDNRIFRHRERLWS